MTTIRHKSREELEQGLEHILASPADNGRLELIVRRPGTDRREVLREARLDTGAGLIGDNWLDRGNSNTGTGGADPDMQLNIMNARVVALVADRPERRELAGDQLYIDMDLGQDNLPPGTRLAIGEAVIEVTEPPHTGCRKFAMRFGRDAMVFVNSGPGRKRCFRGINAKVVVSGDVRVGDRARKVS
jgi:MOSC domain